MSNAIQDAAASAASSAAASAASDVASRATNIGAFTAVGAGFIANNWIGLAGLLIGVAGFLVNWYYKRKTYLLFEKRKGIPE